MYFKDAAKSGQPASATGKKNVLKVMNIIESDGIYTIRDIAKAIVGILHSEACFESTKDFYQMDTPSIDR